MKNKDFVTIKTLSIHYNLKESFFLELNDNQLINIVVINNQHSIHHDEIYQLEKIIRIHVDLDINIQGVDVILNLINEVENLKSKINILKGKLVLIENNSIPLN